MARTAVVAGVGPGLGSSIVRKFAAEGCDVAMLARTESFLRDLADDLADAPGDVRAVPADLASVDEVDAAFATVRAELGPVDALVNHASASRWTGLLDTTPDDLDRTLAVGVRGALRCSQHAVADMLDRSGPAGVAPASAATGEGGAVVFTGATSAVRGREGALGFSAAKFAARGMAQSMARELGPEGIRVAHVVLDGGIMPPEGAPDPEAYLDPEELAATYWDLVEDPRVDTMPFEVHLTNGGGIEFL
ncbi:MAG: SDR family NAD(P)-dependent oxidoreductase [Haloferacaceae archaeon]